MLPRSWEPWWTLCWTACAASEESQQFPGLCQQQQHRSREVMYCLCYAHVGPQLQGCVQVWSARKDDERVQQRVIRMVGGCLSWEEKLRKLCLFSWRSRDFRRPLQQQPVYTLRRLWERAFLFTVLHAGMTMGTSGNNGSSEQVQGKSFLHESSQTAEKAAQRGCAASIL